MGAGVMMVDWNRGRDYIMGHGSGLAVLLSSIDLKEN